MAKKTKMDGIDIRTSTAIPEGVLIAVTQDTIDEANRIDEFREKYPHLRDIAGGRYTLGIKSDRFAFQAHRDHGIPYILELSVDDLLWMREQVRQSLAEMGLA